MTSRTDIGAALRAYRIGGRINQAAIARSLGVSQSQVSRWESGRDRPRAHNVQAIQALVFGREEPVLAALIHQVRAASGPLVLLDGGLGLVAAAPSLRRAGGAIARFGWLFDRQVHPALGLLSKRLRALAAGDSGVCGARLTVPFSHEARPWVAQADLALYRLGPDLFGLGEVRFAPDPDALATPEVLARGSGWQANAARTGEPGARRVSF